MADELERLRRDYNVAVANGLIVRSRQIQKQISALEREVCNRCGLRLSNHPSECPNGLVVNVVDRPCLLGVHRWVYLEEGGRGCTTCGLRA